MSKSKQNKSTKGNINKAKAKKVDIYSTDYGKEVLTVNRNLKTQFRTLAGCLKVLHAYRNDKEIGLKPYQVRILNAWNNKKSNKATYEALKEVVKTSKAGNYGCFKTLQAMRKHKEEILKTIK